MLARYEELSLATLIIRCERLSLTTGLIKFLGYLATIVLNLGCSEQICSLTIFLHGLAKDTSHR